MFHFVTKVLLCKGPYLLMLMTHYTFSCTGMTRLKVAVIGAGAAGLSALRHLAKEPHFYQPVAFEQAFAVGGTWVYTEQTSKDEYGSPIHASMYQNLR